MELQWCPTIEAVKAASQFCSGKSADSTRTQDTRQETDNPIPVIPRGDRQFGQHSTLPPAPSFLVNRSTSATMSTFSTNNIEVQPYYYYVQLGGQSFFGTHNLVTLYTTLRGFLLRHIAKGGTIRACDILLQVQFNCICDPRVKPETLRLRFRNRRCPQLARA